MKNIVYIFIALFISSCAFLNKAENSDNKIIEIVTLDTIYTDDLTKFGVVDSMEVVNYQQGQKGKNKLIRKKVIFYKIVANEDFEKDSIVFLESYDNKDRIKDTDGDGNDDRLEKAIDRKPSSVEDGLIEDRTTPTQLQNPSLGIIAYSIPKEMQVGKTYTVKLRISKEKNKIQIIDGDGIPISDVKVDSRVIISSIRVEPVMSAKLITDASKMLVQPVSTEIQDIEKNGFTEWAWRISPTKGGDVLLRIVVNIKQNIDGNTILKDIPVYDEVISIKSNVAFTTKGFLSQYWQWLMTTVIIPLIVWFYNKKKKNRE